MFDKVKAVLINAFFFIALAAVAAALEFSGTVDWEGFGIFGIAAGAGVASGLDWFRAYLTRERTGYDNGGPGGARRMTTLPGSALMVAFLVVLLVLLLV